MTYLNRVLQKGLLTILVVGVLSLGCLFPQDEPFGCGEKGHFSEIELKERLPGRSAVEGVWPEGEAIIRLTHFKDEDIAFEALAKTWGTRVKRTTESRIHHEHLEPEEYCGTLGSLEQHEIWSLPPGRLWEFRDVLDRHLFVFFQMSLQGYPDSILPFYKDPTFENADQRLRIQTVTVRNGRRKAGFMWPAVEELKNQRYTRIVDILRDLRRDQYDQIRGTWSGTRNPVREIRLETDTGLFPLMSEARPA